MAEGVGARIRRRREHLGWSQAELARRARLSHTFVHGVEAGRTKPGFDALLRLAGALGVSVHYLFGLEGEPVDLDEVKARYPGVEKQVRRMINDLRTLGLDTPSAAAVIKAAAQAAAASERDQREG